MRVRNGWIAWAAAAGLLLPATVRAQSQDAPIHHDSGQSVSPSFEGWFKNADGTFSVSFGYLNRNYKEELDIPIGPNNKIEPGPADQGQPTHFMPRRNTGVFTVVVPADFGKKELTWTIVAHGETISIPGNLRPEWQIDALKEASIGNTPPVLKFDAAGKGGQGPGGIRTEMKATVAIPLTLDVFVTDDGIRNRQGDTDVPNATARRPALGVNWSKYRGPGQVTFGESAPKITNGKATTTASFQQPGDYILRVLAWDNSGAQGAVMAGGFQCCWTNGYVKVTVSPTARTQGREQ